MDEHKNPFTPSPEKPKEESNSELTSEEIRKAKIEELIETINHYTDEEIEGIAAHLDWTIQGPKREGLLGFATACDTVSSVETLKQLIGEAEARMKEDYKFKK